jgi:hypothetical protein
MRDFDEIPVLALRTKDGKSTLIAAHEDILGCIVSALLASGIGEFTPPDHMEMLIDSEKAREIGVSFYAAQGNPVYDA